MKFLNSSLLFITLVVVLLVLAALQTRLAQASASQLDCAQAAGPSTTWIVSTKGGGIMCGRLVFIVGNYPKIYGNPKVSTIGLIPCGSGKPLIFGIHPRSLVPYYQFRDPKIGKGQEICTQNFGCLDQYLTSFQNYVGIEDCAQCGKYGLAPTWTHAPLTPYTPTPVPPTSTPWPTRVTPTAPDTRSPEDFTPTSDLFELLYGATDTPEAGIIPPSQPASTDLSTSALIPPVTPTPVQLSLQQTAQRVAPIALIILALLALLIIPLVTVVRDYLRDR